MHVVVLGLKKWYICILSYEFCGIKNMFKLGFVLFCLFFVVFNVKRQASKSWVSQASLGFKCCNMGHK